MKSRVSIFVPFVVAALAACDAGQATTPAQTAIAAADSVTPQPDTARAGATAGATRITRASSPGRTTCRAITAWLMDPAPEGRNVRIGPSIDTRQIGVLPPPLDADQLPDWGRSLPVQFDVIGSENGWLRIRGAHYDDSLAGQPVPQVFAGEGWISGRGVQVNLQTQTAYAEPSHDAPVLIDARPDTHLDGWPQRGIAGCQDQWVLVDWADPPTPFEGQRQATWREQAIVSSARFTLRGWAAGVCDIMETTCDGVDGSAPATAFRD